MCEKWKQPKDVTNGGIAFGLENIDEYLPTWDEIPDYFKNNWIKPSVASQWFYEGLKDAEFFPRQGMDRNKALQHVKAVLRSWEPKHERKMAGVEYLLSLFFEKIRVKDKEFIYDKN